MAIVLSLGQRILTITQAIDALLQGMKILLLGIVILVLAWSIGSLSVELHTADFLIQMMRGHLSPFLLPALTFLIAAMMSFATGTSWATMAILMPLVIPLANALGLEAQLDAAQASTVLLGTISSVLAGAVFGDHCSPISDTTILSSMASGCDHVDHVRTQLPYALLARAWLFCWETSLCLWASPLGFFVGGDCRDGRRFVHRREESRIGVIARSGAGPSEGLRRLTAWP